MLDADIKILQKNINSIKLIIVNLNTNVNTDTHTPTGKRSELGSC